MTDPLKDVERRTRRYFYEDGAAELALGLFFLALGGYFFAQAALPPGSAAAGIVGMGMILVLVLGGMLVGKLVRLMKSRLVYPRTGYVEYPRKDRSPRRRTLTAATGAVIGALFSALMAMRPGLRSALPSLMGLGMAVAVLLLARKVGLARLNLLAGASAAIGFALTAAGAGESPGLPLYYVLFGAALLVSGAAGFASYWRRSRPGAGGGDGGAGHGD